MKNITTLFFLAMTSLLSACDGGSSKGGGNIDNTPPTANAGQDQTVILSTQVTLDAGLSSDPENDTLTYTWQFIEKPTGSQSVLSSTQNIRPSFITDKTGTYELTLIVSDGVLSSQQDLILIIVTEQNATPTANAGRDQNVSLQSIVWLDGSDSFDTNREQLSYQWAFVQTPTGYTSNLINSTSVTPNFTPSVVGIYEIELIVNDGSTTSLADSVTITVSSDNVAPIAHAGSDQNIPIDSVVSLDGSLSSDANNDSITYLWLFTQMPQDSQAILNSATDRKPTFSADKKGTYILSLVVTDQQVDSLPDLVEITTNVDNTPPIADAGIDQQISLNATVTLDAGGSSDLEGDAMSYSWSFVNKPSASNSSLSDNTFVRPSFIADQPGDYVINVVVSDIFDDSSNDNVIITVIAEDELLSGLVTGALVDTQNNALANVLLRVDGHEVVTDQSGVFSIVVDVAENDTLIVEVIDDRIPAAHFTSSRITNNNSVIGHDFSVNLNTQTLPVFQTISVTLFSCSSLGQGEYSGPAVVKIDFKMDEHESTLFTIEHQQRNELTLDEGTSIQLPAFAKYKVGSNDFQLANNDGIYNETASFTHYTEGGITVLSICDLN